MITKLLKILWNNVTMHGPNGGCLTCAYLNQDIALLVAECNRLSQAAEEHLTHHRNNGWTREPTRRQQGLHDRQTT